MADPIRVLHVEDNDFFAKVAATELESAYDMAIERVAHPERALERLEDAPFDCVVSDYEMPGMDGLTFLAAVRETFPEIPFVLLTGGGSESVASEAITNGVTDYFQKRAGVEQFRSLGNRIENAVARRRAEHAIVRQLQVSELVWDLSQGLLEASAREEIEREICDGLADSTIYRFAWVGTIDDANEAIVPRAVPEARTDDTFLPAAGSERDRAAVRSAVRSGEMVVTTETVEEGPRSTDTLARAVVPLVYEGTSYGTVTVYADRRSAFETTERQTLSKFGDFVAYAIDSVKARNALSRREQCLQVLNRVLRHNLRNDMTVVLGHAENLVEELASGQPVADAEKIRQKASEVTEISAKASEVTETLERANEHRKPVELAGLIERKLEAFEEAYPGASITSETPEEAWVDADFTVATAIEEVIENAIVHNDHDSPTVHVAVSRVDRSILDRIRVAVEDNGPRIPAVEREVLIEGRETALHHSSGLGLWLVNWIVEKFGGEIAFQDNQPRGNVVTVELEAARSATIQTADAE